MEVYVVTFFDNNDVEHVGALYDSFEKAKEHIKRNICIEELQEGQLWHCNCPSDYIITKHTVKQNVENVDYKGCAKCIMH